MPTRLIAALLAAGALAGTSCRLEEAARKQAVGHFVDGQLLADRGDLDGALAELAKAVRNDPNLSVAHCAMGDIYRKRGDNQFARRSYEKACGANPYAFRPHYNLGVVYQFLADAAKTVQKAQGYFRDAVAVYLRATTLVPDDFGASLNLSACYYSLGKYPLAEKYCKVAIAIKPDNPQAYSNLGVIYDSQDRLYEAIKAYSDSLELDVHQPRLLMNLGATYMRQRRLAPALRTFKLATREGPDIAEAWEQLGTCHYHRKEYLEAIEAYEKAVSLNAANAAAHRGLGVVYMTQYVLDHSKEDLRDKALVAWHRSLEVKPDQEEILHLIRKYSSKNGAPEL